MNICRPRLQFSQLGKKWLEVGFQMKEQPVNKLNLVKKWSFTSQIPMMLMLEFVKNVISVLVAVIAQGVYCFD